MRLVSAVPTRFDSCAGSVAFSHQEVGRHERTQTRSAATGEAARAPGTMHVTPAAAPSALLRRMRRVPLMCCRGLDSTVIVERFVPDHPARTDLPGLVLIIRSEA